MSKKELTEEDRRLFLKYESIPAGYSKAEMVELTGQNIQTDDRRYDRKIPILNKNIYNFCEICKRRTTSSYYPPGQRFQRTNGGNDILGRTTREYCHICHKSMCFRCTRGIICKNCVEFFTERTKNKYLAVRKRLMIVSVGLTLLSIIVVLSLVAVNPSTVLYFGMPRYTPYILMVLLVVMGRAGHYFTIAYFEDTVEKFLKELKDNPKEHENLEEVYAVYFDSFEHPESISRYKGRVVSSLISRLIGGILFVYIGLELMGV